MVEKMTEEQARDSIADALEKINAAAYEAVTPQEMLDRMHFTAEGVGQDYKVFRLELLCSCGIFIDDAMVKNPALEKEMLLRFVGNELLTVCALVIRGMKKKLGEDLSPARMALVAYAMAEHIAGLPWIDDLDPVMLNDKKPGEFRAAMEQMAKELNS